MKSVSKPLKIIAIVLNAIFLAGLIYGVTRYGVHLRDLHDRVGFIFTLVFPTVTLVTIALIFHKKLRILTFILKVIAIIVNASFLVILISAIVLKGVNLKQFSQLMVLIWGLGLPVINIAACVLPVRKAKAAAPT